MEDCASGEESDVVDEDDIEEDDIEDIEILEPMKRSITRDNSNSSSSSMTRAQTMKRGVTISTVEKWKRDYKSLNTSLWLKYDKMDREFVSPLKCKVCKQFTNKLQSARNFNPAFIMVRKTFVL